MRKGIFILFVLLFCINVFAGDTPKANDNLNVVLVSSNIQNAEAIADAANDEAVAVVYDFEKTNLREINLTLEELIKWKNKQIDHLVIICHGAPGNLLLGAEHLIDLKKVEKEKNEWEALGKLLSANARIDFYGCEVGWGEAGQKFVNAVSYLTGASVQASDDASGNIHDADWELEVKTGSSNQPSLINFSQLLKTPIYF